MTIGPKSRELATGVIASMFFILASSPNFGYGQPTNKEAISILLTRENGVPASRATVGTRWQIAKYKPGSPLSRIPRPDNNVLSAPNGITAAEDGRLTFPIESEDLPKGILALSEDRREGAVAVIDDDSIGKELVIHLHQLRSVTVAIDRPLPDSSGPQLISYQFTSAKSRNVLYAATMECSAHENHIETALRIPAGAYELLIQNQDCALWSGHLIVTGGEGDPNIHVQARLVPTFMRAYAGKAPPPFCTTGSVGAIGEDALKARQGQPVLIVFWNYRPLPSNCNQDIYEPLIVFFRNFHRTGRDNVVFVHCDTGVKNEVDYKTKVLEPLQRTYENANVPVNVLLDGDLCTFRRWGIDGTHVPTAVLLNKEGVVVEQGRPWELLLRIEGNSPRP